MAILGGGRGGRARAARRPACGRDPSRSERGRAASGRGVGNARARRAGGMGLLVTRVAARGSAAVGGRAGSACEGCQRLCAAAGAEGAARAGRAPRGRMLVGGAERARGAARRGAQRGAARHALRRECGASGAPLDAAAGVELAEGHASQSPARAQQNASEALVRVARAARPCAGGGRAAGARRPLVRADVRWPTPSGPSTAPPARITLAASEIFPLASDLRARRCSAWQ